MITLPLTRGQVAIIDDVDAPLAELKWSFLTYRGSAYAIRRGSRRLHREVWARAHPDQAVPRVIDHINGNGLDCRRENLRAATSAENSRNMRRHRDNRVGFKGVCFHPGRRKPWQAHIWVDGHQRSGGYYSTPEDAARAYDSAARRFYGAFVALNFPNPGERAA